MPAISPEPAGPESCGVTGRVLQRGFACRGYAELQRFGRDAAIEAQQVSEHSMRHRVMTAIASEHKAIGSLAFLAREETTAQLE